MRIRHYYLLIIFFGVFFLLYPWFVNPYFLFILNMFFIYVILSLGLNLLLGYAGQFAFASSAFYGIGAYVVLLLQVKLGCSFWLSFIMAGFITAMIGLIISFPAIRLSGLYLAIVTISFALLTQWIFIHWHSLTFGAGGHKCPAPNFSFFSITTEVGMYYLSFLTVVLITLITWNITRSKIGRAFVAIKENEIIAQSMGINLVVYKLLAFALSGLYAGIAGGLFAGVLKFVAPENFGLFETIIQFTMVVLGGLGSIIGSIFGAGVILFLIEITRGLHTLQEILFGGLIIVTVIFLPSGLYGIIKNRFPKWREPLSRR